MRSNSLYITATEADSGKSLVVLGVMELLTRTIGRVGFFRPVARIRDNNRDPNIELISTHFRLDFEDSDLYGVTSEEARELLLEEQEDLLLKRIFEKFKALEQKCAFIICEGTDFTGFAQPVEFDFNSKIAANLGSPILIVLNGKNKDPASAADVLELTREAFQRENCILAAAVLNRTRPELIDELERHFAQREKGELPVFVLPEEPRMTQLTLNDVRKGLQADVLAGKTSDLMREIRDIKIAAMTVGNVLNYISDGCLIITPGDRQDVIVTSLLASVSDSYPAVSGLLLTGGLKPEAAVEKLLDGVNDFSIPVLAVNSDTLTTATALNSIKPRITADNQKKIASGLDLFETCIDSNELFAHITIERPKHRTPIMFEYELIQRAKQKCMHVVLPEGTDERILQAAEILQRRRAVQLTLLGEPDSVHRAASALGVELGDIPIVDPINSELRNKYAERFYELRKHKGVTKEQAFDVVSDVSYFGTMMVFCADADGMVSGAAHTTQHTIRPSFQTIKTKPGVSVVSSVFLICLPSRVVVFGDCAVLPDPSSQQLADIAISSAETASSFGIEPRIALLSYSTGKSGVGSDVDKVREAAALAKELRPDLLLEGPLQFDAAFDPSVAEKKAPESEVAGQATVFVFPDLNTGNNTYKAVQRTSGAVAIGPVLQGLKKPVNDLSRGCTVTDVVNTVAITAIQAQLCSAQ